MTTDAHRTIIDTARAAILSGAPSITVDPRDLLVLGNELQRLEAELARHRALELVQETRRNASVLRYMSGMR